MSKRLSWRLATSAVAAQLAATMVMANVGDLLRQNAIVPVEPPMRATDFTLPLLDGASGSLSDFQGRWVLLTFWASWCGPCRVEMPTLEELHQLKGSDGLAVVGVSLDNSLELARSFAEQVDVSFPQFWDESGSTGADYRASAIPLTYLIDPAGQIVGSSRGARDWSALEPMLDELLGEATDLAASGYAPSGPLALPAVLDPPTAEIELIGGPFRVDREFFLDIRMRWAGRLEEYLPLPPTVRLPEGVSIDDIVASTDSRDGGNVVTYRLSLRADRAGTYALDPVELRYMPSSTGSPVVSLADGPTVDVRESGLKALRPSQWAMAGGLLAAIAAGGWVMQRRRSKLEAGPAVEVERYQVLRARLDGCRALRLEGRPAELALRLAELELDLAEDDEREQLRLKGLIESLRFGGQVPPSSALDSMYRGVERQIESLRPDPDQDVRSRLRVTRATS